MWYRGDSLSMSQEETQAPKHEVSFAAKVITLGVVFKALLMGIIVEVLALTSFQRSIILVLVSATATGIFGILIVLIQVHSEKQIHDRIDQVQEQIDIKSDEIKQQATTIANGESK